MCYFFGPLEIFRVKLALKKASGPKNKKIMMGCLPQKKSSFRVKFSLLIAEFSGDLCKQDCSLNGIAFI